MEKHIVFRRHFVQDRNGKTTKYLARSTLQSTVFRLQKSHKLKGARFKLTQADELQPIYHIKQGRIKVDVVPA